MKEIILNDYLQTSLIDFYQKNVTYPKQFSVNLHLFLI